MKGNGLSSLGRRTQSPPISWLIAAALETPGLISLAAGFTDNPTLPVRETRELLRGLLKSNGRGQHALQYGTTAGDAELRRLTSRHLAGQDGVPVKSRTHAPERMMITHGSQQLLYIVTEVLCDEGDIVLVEDPTYFVFLGILQSHGLHGRGLRVDRDGIDLAHLAETLERLKRAGELPRLKALYMVSHFSNPTGITTGYDRKAGALKLLRKYESAAGHPIYLIEDAAYRELRFAGPDVTSALLADPLGERVIYAGTYSKPFATGVRIGFGLLPEPVLTAALRVKGNHDFGTSHFLQQLIARAMASGAFTDHLSVLRRRYASKAAAMGKALRAHMPGGVEWSEPNGGLYYWVRVPASVKVDMDSALFQAALRHKVIYVPGNLCYTPDRAGKIPNHEMRVSFGGASIADIAKGVARLGKALDEVF